MEIRTHRVLSCRFSVCSSRRVTFICTLQLSTVDRRSRPCQDGQPLLPVTSHQSPATGHQSLPSHAPNDTTRETSVEPRRKCPLPTTLEMSPKLRPLLGGSFGEDSDER